MHIDLTPEQLALRDELREYFASIPRSHGATAWNEPRAPDYRDVCKRLGDDGWLGVGWPTEYGGQGRGPMEQLIFFTEAERARVPMPVIALNTVGPTLMRYGSEAQKDFFQVLSAWKRHAASVGANDTFSPGEFPGRVGLSSGTRCSLVSKGS